MKKAETRILVYDSHCPMCSWYTGEMVKTGMLDSEGRVAFEQLDPACRCLLDPDRARHEIPMIDMTKNEILYGIDALTVVISNRFTFLQPFITKDWFKAMLRPLYSFISYNRRIMAGSVPERACDPSFAPDFHLGWRLALIAAGFGYVALCICIFAALMAVPVLMLFAAVTTYFLILLGLDLTLNGNIRQKWDYLAHLAVLGFVEGSLFVITALLAKVTGLTGLMFAGQGLGRMVATWLHVKRVRNNQYAPILNIAFAACAAALVVVIAILKR